MMPAADLGSGCLRLSFSGQLGRWNLVRQNSDKLYISAYFGFYDLLSRPLSAVNAINCILNCLKMPKFQWNFFYRPVQCTGKFYTDTIIFW